MRNTTLALLAAFALTHSHTFGSGAAPGDRVEALEIEHWVKIRQGTDGKSRAIEKLEPGTVYLIDFWATWCAPCVAGFEKVSDIQDDYLERGVRVVAVTEEQLSTVSPFMQRSFGSSGLTNDERCRFDVAVDPDGSTLAAMIPEAMHRQRPIGAIIDAQGRVAWIGLPDDSLRGILDAVLDGTWDIQAFADSMSDGAAELRKTEILENEDWAAAQDEFWDDTEFLSKISFSIAFNFGGAVKNPDPETARTFIERVIELTESPGAYEYSILAKVEHNAGNHARAVQLQRRVIRLNNASDERENYAAFYASLLETYRAALSP